MTKPLPRFVLLCLLLLAALPASPGLAEASRDLRTERWVEEWDPASQRWLRLADVTGGGWESASVPGRKAIEARAPAGPIAAYGPFLVLDENRAALVGSTDRHSPLQFDRMMADFPQLSVIEMIDAPGTVHDIANLELGRRIRAAGLATHVPSHGSVRSGAVELFLAGARRTMEPGARFAVHAWLDESGRQPGDFPPDHPAHRLYIDYYLEMGMNESEARAFYAMTNSVPHSQALWFGRRSMRAWIGRERGGPPQVARLSYDTGFLSRPSGAARTQAVTARLSSSRIPSALVSAWP